MVGSHKVLTVSYGTFSCTLEGFEDSFGTMKAIAEYFRDLAADDRYFGAVPPVPDAAMLARIAEREVARRVEARLDGSSVHLRVDNTVAGALGHDAAPVAAPGPVAVAAVAAALPEPAATPPVDEAAAAHETPPEEAPEWAPQVAEPAGLDDWTPDAPVPAMPPAVALPAHPDAESVAAKLQRIRAVVGRAAPAAAAPVAAPVVPTGEEPVAPGRPRVLRMRREDFEAAVASGRIEDMRGAGAQPAPSGLSPEKEADLLAELASLEAEREDVPAAPAMPPEAIPAAALEAPPVQEAARTEAEAAPEAVAAQPEAVAPEAPVREEPAWEAPVWEPPASEAPAREEPAALAAEQTEAPSPVAQWPQVEAPRPEAPEAPEPVAAAPAETAAVAAWDAESAGPAVVEAERPGVGGEVSLEAPQEAPMDAPSEAGPADLEAEADGEADEARRAEAARAAVGGLMASLRGLAPEPRGAEAVAPEAVAALLEGAGDRVPAARDEDEVINLFAGSDEAEDDAWARAEAGDREADDREAAGTEALGPDVAAEPLDEPAAAAVLATLPEPVAEAEAGAEAPAEATHPVLGGDRDEAAVSRLMSEADAQLAEPEAQRRREAIAQLKAAVAATEAARRLGEAPARPEERAEPFRADLREAVRPRRPLAPEALRGERPRPAPLRLVESQRVDLAAEEPLRVAPPRPAPGPVRPRRVTVDQSAAAPSADRGRGFAAFAQEMGASSLTDVLEAAAAYVAFVEGHQDFSRPQVIDKAKALALQGYSREDGLRSFGILLREGRIQRAPGMGRFQVSADTRFNPERRAV